MRNIKPALISFIDNKLRDNGSAQKALKEKDARSLLIYAAEACVGEKEEGRDNHGTFVELCQKTVDNTATGESWCMCFIQSIIAYVETKLNLISPIYSNENCLTVWENTPDTQIVKNYPNRGAIAIWRETKLSTKTERSFTNPKRKYRYSGSGHTAFIVEFNPDLNVKTITTVEGNTNYGGSRDGDGVYKKNTRKKIKEGGESNLELVGFLIPFIKS